MKFWKRREPEIGPVSQQYFLAAQYLGIDVPKDKPISFLQISVIVSAMARRIRSLEEKSGT